MISLSKDLMPDTSINDAVNGDRADLNKMVSKNRILVLIDWYDPGFKAGGQIQSIKNLVRTLEDEYQFYILTSDRDLGDKEPYKGVKINSWEKISKSVSIFYAAPNYMDKKRFINLINEINPSIVYFNSMFSKQYTLLPILRLKNSNFTGKLILAPRGMLHKGALRKKTFKKKTFLTLFRMLGVQKKITFHATDLQEQNDIKQFFPRHVKVILAKDTPPHNATYRDLKNKNTGELKCLFLSRIHPKKNLLFLLNCLSMVNRKLEIVLNIYGEKEDIAYSGKCVETASKMNGNIRINFHGPLNHEKVSDTLATNHLFILPTLGENFGHAIFESLAAGRPVLISDQTPWRNLTEHKAGWDLPLDQPQKFVDVIEHVAQMNSEQLHEWCIGAWNFCKNYLEQSNIKDQYLKLFS